MSYWFDMGHLERLVQEMHEIHRLMEALEDAKPDGSNYVCPDLRAAFSVQQTLRCPRPANTPSRVLRQPRRERPYYWRS